MSQIANTNLDYKRPIKIVGDVFWVGFGGSNSGIHCNPYLIVDEDEAVLIDGGSRPDFATVMMKTMQTGVEPHRISKLIYHHYDPDLCCSIPNLEALIDNPDTVMISQKLNNYFIHYYAPRSKMECIDEMGRKLELKSGRTLRFIPTPYAHSAGSFMTYDEKSSILFTSDLFGGYINRWWDLFYEFPEQCRKCKEEPPADNRKCSIINDYCAFPELYDFHRQIMPSVVSLRYALDQIRGVDPAIVAPQHGSVLHRRDDIKLVIDRLYELTDIGIDGVIS